MDFQWVMRKKTTMVFKNHNFCTTKKYLHNSQWGFETYWPQQNITELEVLGLLEFVLRSLWVLISGHVTHADASVMHVSMMQVSVMHVPNIHDACIHDACIHDTYFSSMMHVSTMHVSMMHVSMMHDPWSWCKCMYDEYIYVPQPLTLMPECMTHISMILDVDPEACMYVWFLTLM